MRRWRSAATRSVLPEIKLAIDVAVLPQVVPDADSGGILAGGAAIDIRADQQRDLDSRAVDQEPARGVQRGAGDAEQPAADRAADRHGAQRPAVLDTRRTGVVQWLPSRAQRLRRYRAAH